VSPDDSAWETPPFQVGPPVPPRLSPDKLEVIRAEDEAMEDADRARRVAARTPGASLATLDSAPGLTAEHKARISAALKGRSVNGSTLSAEHKVRAGRERPVCDRPVVSTTDGDMRRLTDSSGLPALCAPSRGRGVYSLVGRLPQRDTLCVQIQSPSDPLAFLLMGYTEPGTRPVMP
jgi:hypothetical protein